MSAEDNFQAVVATLAAAEARAKASPYSITVGPGADDKVHVHGARRVGAHNVLFNRTIEIPIALMQPQKVLEAVEGVEKDLAAYYVPEA